MKRLKTLTAEEIRRRRKFGAPMSGHDGCFYLNRPLKVRFKTEANRNSKTLGRRDVAHIIGFDKDGCRPGAVFLRGKSGWWSVGCFEII